MIPALVVIVLALIVIVLTLIVSVHEAQALLFGNLVGTNARGGPMPGESPAWRNTEMLVVNIRDYHERCGGTALLAVDVRQSCNSEKSDLLARQAKMAVSNRTINEMLNARQTIDWKWP